MGDIIESNYNNTVASILLGIKAVILNTDDPFTWASGYRMPIYNDNRMLLGSYQHRNLVVEAFKDIIKSYEIPCDIIAGTSTSGIPPATTLADKLKCPLIYIRDKPKDHGLKNQIEGIGADEDLKEKKVVLIEDLVSTGGSSIKAVEAIRQANGIIDYCLAIFHYGFDEAEEAFSEIGCNLIPILRYETLLKMAKSKEYINEEELKLLEEWRLDPLNWGKKHGFPEIKR